MKRAAKPNLAAIARALPPSWTAALRDMCDVLGLHTDNWDAVPGVRGAAEALALYRRADELRAEHRWGQERAMLAASAELGLDCDTVGRRVREWLRAAFEEPEVSAENLLGRGRTGMRE